MTFRLDFDLVSATTAMIPSRHRIIFHLPLLFQFLFFSTLCVSIVFLHMAFCSVLDLPPCLEYLLLASSPKRWNAFDEWVVIMNLVWLIGTLLFHDPIGFPSQYRWKYSWWELRTYHIQSRYFFLGPAKRTPQRFIVCSHSLSVLSFLYHLFLFIFSFLFLCHLIDFIDSRWSDYISSVSERYDLWNRWMKRHFFWLIWLEELQES